jgi:hypothetical protein
MSRRSVRARACAVVVSVIAATVLGWGAATLAAAAVPSDQATFINAALQPLYAGGSTTQFGLSLPGQGGQEGSTQAFCANYSQSNPQQLDSYLVPEGTDPSTVTFSPAGPSTGGGLFESTGSYYGFQSTNNTTGALPSLPGDFEWEPLVSGNFETLNELLSEGTTPGVWETGLACVNEQGADQGQVTTLWNIQITFVASSSDPNGFTWKVPTPPPPTTTTTTSPPATTNTSSTSTTTPSSGSGSSATSGPTGSGPSATSDDGDLGEGFATTSPVSNSAASTATVSKGTAASNGTGQSGSGSNAPVKDPGILHDALTAAGLSSARGIALDLLGVGLLLVVLGFIRRRKSDGTEEPAS